MSQPSNQTALYLGLPRLKHGPCLAFARSRPRKRIQHAQFIGQRNQAFVQRPQRGPGRQQRGRQDHGIDNTAATAIELMPLNQGQHLDPACLHGLRQVSPGVFLQITGLTFARNLWMADERRYRLPGTPQGTQMPRNHFADG